MFIRSRHCTSDMLLSLSYIIASFVIITVPLNAVTNIQFDEYGNKYIRTTMSSGSERTFTVDVQKDEYLYVQGSSSLHLQLLHESNATSTTFESETDALGQDYYLLDAPDTQRVCEFDDPSTECTFQLIASLDGGRQSDTVWIRLNRNVELRPWNKYSNDIPMRKRRRYGLRITSSDLPVLVEMQPNKYHRRMDLDLYGYTEHEFTTYFFPNRNERNHIDNTAERILVTARDTYFEDGEFYFFEVYGSTDSSFTDMNYSLMVKTNYAPHSLLKRVLLIFAMIIAGSFICGIGLSFLCNFRHQILFLLRIRSTPHRNGATKRQIRKLKVIQFKQRENVRRNANYIESPQCIICLDDYAENDRIRILNCHHDFHKKCSDEWLFINKKCPLCNQDIVEAEDCHQQMAEVEMVELQRLQIVGQLLDSEESHLSEGVEREEE